MSDSLRIFEGGIGIRDQDCLIVAKDKKDAKRFCRFNLIDVTDAYVGGPDKILAESALKVISRGRVGRLELVPQRSPYGHYLIFSSFQDEV